MHTLARTRTHTHTHTHTHTCTHSHTHTHMHTHAHTHNSATTYIQCHVTQAQSTGLSCASPRQHVVCVTMTTYCTHLNSRELLKFIALLGQHPLQQLSHLQCREEGEDAPKGSHDPDRFTAVESVQRTLHTHTQTKSNMVALRVWPQDTYVCTSTTHKHMVALLTVQGSPCSSYHGNSPPTPTTLTSHAGRSWLMYERSCSAHSSQMSRKAMDASGARSGSVRALNTDCTTGGSRAGCWLSQELKEPRKVRRVLERVGWGGRRGNWANTSCK